MSDKYVDDLYESFTANFLKEISSNSFYDYFINMARSKAQNLTVNEKYIERTVDLKWVEAIEKAIIPLDTIIRNPGRYIRRDEDVVRIERARDIGPEAVRHLAQHTSMIAKVERDEVTPERILNITKEEAFDTYENRFIYTLLKQVQYFLDRRLAVLNQNAKMEDKFEYRLNGDCSVGTDNVNFNFSMDFTTPHENLPDDLQLDIDTTKLTDLERVNRVRRIIYSFQYSPFCKALDGCALVRPPLTMTNVLTKNQNFVKAVELWNYVSMYTDVGYAMDFIDRQVTPGDKALNELYSVVMLQYILLKKYTHKDISIGDVSERRQLMAPNVIKRNIDNLITTYDLSIDQVKRIFEDEIQKRERKRDAQFKKARGIVARAIETEEALAKEELRARAERIERELKRQEELRLAEERRIERERKAAERAAEKLRKEAEMAAKKAERERKAAELAEQKRLAAEEREKARIERERIKAEQAEAARIERERKAAELAEKRRIEAEEKEKARIERERIRAEKLEAERIEKERLAVERAEKARIAAEEKAKAEEAARIERERIAAEKAEKARIAAEEKAKAEEAARIERERIAAEKATKAAEEARILAEKLKEEARIAAEKAAKAEAERIEMERLAAMYAPFKGELERIDAELEKAKKMSRRKKKQAKRKLSEEREAINKAMPDELKDKINKK